MSSKFWVCAAVLLATTLPVSIAARHGADARLAATVGRQSTASTPELTDTSRILLLEPIRSVHHAQENTGFTFALTQEGGLGLVDFAGRASVEDNIPIDLETRFPVMSITKAFTGLALATAVSEGLVELDVPISRYLPDYEGEGKDTITLRQLATHTSGIPHTGHPDRRELYVEHFEDAGSSRSVYEDRPLAFEPGSGYLYSSSGYNLIAAIIERASAMNFKDYVRQNVIDPLGLENTYFGDVLRPTPGQVRNYSHVDIWKQPWKAADELQQVPTWDFSYNLGGGNMYSTAEDLVRLGNALLQREGLAPEVWEIALSSGAESGLSSPWNLGWIRGQDEWGRETISITGATPGVQAALYVYPDQGIVFAALANCWGKNSASAELVIGAPQEIVNAIATPLTS